MSANLIIITGLIYAYVAAEQWMRGNHGMALAFAGYSFSNYGLWLASSR